jgi:hypothetical protein
MDHEILRARLSRIVAGCPIVHDQPGGTARLVAPEELSLELLRSCAHVVAEYEFEMGKKPWRLAVTGNKYVVREHCYFTREEAERRICRNVRTVHRFFRMRAAAIGQVIRTSEAGDGLCLLIKWDMAYTNIPDDTVYVPKDEYDYFFEEW